jgi:hypothetical protein
MMRHGEQMRSSRGPALSWPGWMTLAWPHRPRGWLLRPRAQSVQLTEPGELLTRLTKQVLETAL